MELNLKQKSMFAFMREFVRDYLVRNSYLSTKEVELIPQYKFKYVDLFTVRLGNNTYFNIRWRDNKSFVYDIKRLSDDVDVSDLISKYIDDGKKIRIKPYCIVKGIKKDGVDVHDIINSYVNQFRIHIISLRDRLFCIKDARVIYGVYDTVLFDQIEKIITFVSSAQYYSRALPSISDSFVNLFLENR